MAQQADAEENQIALFEPQVEEAQLDVIQHSGDYVYYKFFLDGYEPAPEGEVAGSGQEEGPSSESSVPPEGGQGNQETTTDQALRHTLTIGWNTTPSGEAGLEKFVSENSGKVTAVEGCPGGLPVGRHGWLPDLRQGILLGPGRPAFRGHRARGSRGAPAGRDFPRHIDRNRYFLKNRTAKSPGRRKYLQPGPFISDKRGTLINGFQGFHHADIPQFLFHHQIYQEREHHRQQERPHIA